MNEWFWSDGGPATGPVSFAAMQDLVRAGTVRRETQVRHASWQNWAPAGSVVDLATAFGGGMPLPPIAPAYEAPSPVTIPLPPPPPASQGRLGRWLPLVAGLCIVGGAVHTARSAAGGGGGTWTFDRERLYDEWVEVQSPDWGFSATFPGVPEEDEVEGSTIPSRRFRFGGDAAANYEVVVWEQPRGTRPSIADVQREIDGGIARSGWVAKRSRAVTSNGVPGAETEFEHGEFPSLRVRSRYFVVSNRVYKVLVNGCASAVPDDVRFLDSVRITR